MNIDINLCRIVFTLKMFDIQFNSCLASLLYFTFVTGFQSLKLTKKEEQLLHDAVRNSTDFRVQWSNIIGNKSGMLNLGFNQNNSIAWPKNLFDNSKSMVFGQNDILR